MPEPGRFRRALPSILSVALALLLCLVGLAIAKGSLPLALEAYGQLFIGGLGDIGGWLQGGRITLITRPLGETAIKASLLALVGLSVAVGFRVGLFNIGAQGQMMLGALAAAVVGAQLSLPAWLHVPVCLLVACVAGALWALPAGVLKLRRGVHEVISTIMLNWIAISLIDNWLAVGPLRAAATLGASRSGTDDVQVTAHLPRLFGALSRMNFGLVIALSALVLVWFWLFRSVHGFESRVAGLAPEAAQTAGIAGERRVLSGFLVSGALAGLAGAVWVLGTEFKYPGSLGAPYGFDGIGIALIGQNHPLGVGLSALFFGLMRAGGTRLQLFGVHKSFPELVQGLALLFVAANWAWGQLLARRVRPETGAPGANGDAMRPPLPPGENRVHGAEAGVGAPNASHDDDGATGTGDRTSSPLSKAEGGER
ncbi:MAG TPA: ABC transporter permease [Myxococcaceae bacterium]|nr:ABC transporter permease [Myxococcaceae bacterium]